MRPAQDHTRPLRALTLEQLRSRSSVKWQLHGPDVLPLWVAELDAPLAEPVVAAVTSAMAAGDTGYAFGTGYAAAYSDFAERRWGQGFDVDRTALVPDVMRGIVEVLRLVTGPGDPVVVNSPVYTPFYEFLRHAGHEVVEAPLTEAGRLDLEGLEKTFAALAARPDGRTNSGGGDRVRPAYLLCNPHNPTGTVHTRDELAAVGALTEEYGVRLVVDEIHAPLVHPGHVHHSFAGLPEGRRAFSVLSASKAWNLAGIKAALVVAGPGAADELRRLPEEVQHGASHLGCLSHTAALREGGDWLDALLVDLDENRRLLADLLAAHLPEVGYRPPEGTYLAWLRFPERHVPGSGFPGLGEDPAAAILERCRVALVSGPAFGTGGAGHARLNLGTTPEILEQAVRRMATLTDPTG